MYFSREYTIFWVILLGCLTGNADKNVEYNWKSELNQFPYENVENIYNTEELYFDDSVPKNVLGYVGDSVSLRCVIHNLGTKPVMWIRHRDLHILAENFDMYISDDRFRISHNEESKEWTLHINSVELKDKGTYECQVPMQPVKSYTFQLDIIAGGNFRKGKSTLHIESSLQQDSMNQEIFQQMYADQEALPAARYNGSECASQNKSKILLFLLFLHLSIMKYLQIL